MAQANGEKKLGKNEFYKCPLPHTQSKHRQELFKDFETHFSIFSNRDDHMDIVQAHEDLVWSKRCEAAEKGKLSEEEINKVSQEAWLKAVKQCTGKAVTVVTKK